jgi:holo-[acyl-carrier protein] synthase
MDIIGTGAAVVECLRIARLIDRHGEVFLTRIYTEREIQTCHAQRRTTQNFAARWAAKEAVFKALGLSGNKGLRWTDVEVRHDPSGRHKARLSGATREAAGNMRVTDMHLAIAHCRSYATASAIALGNLT